MTRADRMTLVSALAVLLTMTALMPVFEDQTWFLPALAAVAVGAGTTLAARRARVPDTVQPLLSLLALGAYVVARYAGHTLHHLVLPGRDTELALRELFLAAGVAVQENGPPAPVLPELELLVVLGVGAVAVAVQAVAGPLRRPAAAGLPLLVLFAVPSALLPGGGLGALPFLLGATGWLALLLADGREEVGRWGVRVGPSRPAGDAALGQAGRRIGVTALGVAVLVPALIPGLDVRLLDEGTGGGSGIGLGRSVPTYNPITRLRGELTLPQPVDVLRYTTTDPDPDYLRLTTLGRYDGNGWHQDPLEGDLGDDGVRGRDLPPAVGRRPTAVVRPVDATVEVLNLDAYWLPVPVTPAAVQVRGPWMWDPTTESVFATRADTEDLEPYRVASLRVLPQPEVLAAAPSVRPLEVQPYVGQISATDRVREITSRVVAGADTDYERAVALQTFFRDPDNRFTYDEQTVTGGSPDALQDFLEQRRGFCEQYASAMAAMLRLAGVPSRVAVGFTAGTRTPDGSYLVTTEQAHAWPEAWFDGLGWVRFEPTPAQNGVQPPAYGAPAAGAPDARGGGSAPDLAPGPSEAQQESSFDRRERLGAQAATPPPAPAQEPEPGLPVARVLVALAVLLLAAGPALLHQLRRWQRARRPDAHSAWQQVQDDAVDVGHRWSDAESPRQAAARLSGERSLSPEAAAALGRVVTAVERARYGRPGVAAGGLDALAPDVRLLRRSLRRRAPLRRRALAGVLPPSTLRWAGRSLVTGGRTLTRAGQARRDAAVQRLRAVRRRRPV